MGNLNNCAGFDDDKTGDLARIDFYNELLRKKRMNQTYKKERVSPSGISDPTDITMDEDMDSIDLQNHQSNNDFFDDDIIMS